MKTNIIALTVFCSSVVALCIGAPVKAEMGQNSIGPSISIGGGTTTFGVDSKFGVADNLSLRPFVYFPSGSTDFGAALTYDFNLKGTDNNTKITPFVGGALDINTNFGSSVTTASLVAGADYDLTDSVQLKGAVHVPLSTNQGQSTNVILGAGVRF